jgi:hypothetical protein
VNPAPSPASPLGPYQVYIPSPRAFAESQDTFPLPNYLRALIQSARRRPDILMNAFGSAGYKPADTVDYGDEVDYSGYEWFKDPPPRPEVRLLS